MWVAGLPIASSGTDHAVLSAIVKKHSCGACPSFLVEPEPALGITKDHKKVFLLANSVADPYHFPGSASKFGLDPDQ